MPRSPNQVARSCSCRPPAKSKAATDLPQKATSARLSASASRPAASRGSGAKAMNSAPPSGRRMSVSVIQPFAMSAHRDEDDGEDGEAGGERERVGAHEAGLQAAREGCQAAHPAGQALDRPADERALDER